MTDRTEPRQTADLVKRLRADAEGWTKSADPDFATLPTEAADAIEELTAALLKALPFVEDALTSAEFKPGYVPKTVDHIRDLLSKYGGASNG